MRANISINTDGITQPSVKPAPPDGGATVNRNNQSFVVTISANPSARALSALVRTLRAFETKIELHGAGDAAPPALTILAFIAPVFDSPAFEAQ